MAASLRDVGAEVPSSLLDSNDHVETGLAGDGSTGQSSETGLWHDGFTNQLETGLHVDDSVNQSKIGSCSDGLANETETAFRGDSLVYQLQTGLYADGPTTQLQAMITTSGNGTISFDQSVDDSNTSRPGRDINLNELTIDNGERLQDGQAMGSPTKFIDKSSLTDQNVGDNPAFLDSFFLTSLPPDTSIVTGDGAAGDRSINHENDHEVNGDEINDDVVVELDDIIIWSEPPAITEGFLFNLQEELSPSIAGPRRVDDAIRYSQPTNFVKTLPTEASEQICFHLSPTDLCNFSSCSTECRNIANSDALWQNLCAKRGWSHFDCDPVNLWRTQWERLSKPTRNVSGISPQYYPLQSSVPSLSPMCKWKALYHRASHLMENWTKGRYDVLPILRGHRSKVTAIDSNGELLVSGGDDCILNIWDLKLCELILTLETYPCPITHLKIVGELVVSACEDGSVRVYSTSTGQLRQTLESDGANITSLIPISYTVIACAYTDKLIRMWDITDGKLQKSLLGHTDEIECLAVCKNLLVSGSWDNNLLLWSVASGDLIASFQGHSEVVTCCQLDNEVIVSGSADGTVREWNISSRLGTLALYAHNGEVYCVAFNDEVIASGGSDSYVNIWTRKGDLILSSQEHIGVVRCLHLSRERLVSAGDRKKIVVWDYKKAKAVNILHRQPTLVHLMWVNDILLITAPPDSTGTLTILKYW